MTDHTAGSDEQPVHTRLSGYVGGKASALQDAYLRDDSDAVAALALLRRGIGLAPGADPRLIRYTVADLYLSPERLSDEPAPAEVAAYDALTLFALHQQSHRSQRMHRRDYSFGRSCRLLQKHTGARDAVRRRFTAVSTATTSEELLHHARGLIQQLRAEGIPLDYGRFALDLYRLRFPAAADRVRLSWGRDFYRTHHPEDDGDDSAAASPNSDTSKEKA